MAAVALRRCNGNHDLLLQRPVVDVIKLFWRNSGKSRFPPKLKQQEQAISKSINSFREMICLKLALYSHFSPGSDIRTNFITFLNFGEIQISYKKCFITSTTGRTLQQPWWQAACEEPFLRWPASGPLGTSHCQDFQQDSCECFKSTA